VQACPAVLETFPIATDNSSLPGQLGAGHPRHLQGPTDGPAAGRRGIRRDGGNTGGVVLHEMVGVNSVSPIGHSRKPQTVMESQSKLLGTRGGMGILDMGAWP
jgi:hypothetical protein